MPKQLHVNLFEMNCVSHIIHGLWVHPDNNRHRFNDIEYWIELAKLLEAGTFDGVFIADVIGTYDQFRQGPETAIREGMQIPSNDPLLIIPAMASVTKNLGFGVTFSTSYEPPFAFARRMSTLDHLTKGRVAWNIVTSYLPNAARNFGLDDEIPHDQRYQLADEYLDVLYKLWEGSWDDDAVQVDRKNRIYADPAKVRYINHVSNNYKVAGPHLCEPSRQRTPLLFQATGSSAGIEFAGRHAEAIFTGGSSAEEVQRNINGIREKAKAHGRDPAGIKFFVGASVIVAPTNEEVEEKLKTFHELHSVDAALVHLQSSVDLTLYPRETKLKEIIPENDQSWGLRWADSEETVGGLLDKFRFRQDRFFVAGTPTHVADTIEKWLDEDGIDGINLIQYLSYGTAKDFIELVVPELRRRGRFREKYADGETLRERFFGQGHARLPDDHYAARYRNPENLHAASEPLPLAQSREVKV
ncbi:LLM class flavin-dependent oxidoreductase [Acinetobacter qingfengensis]|uniref:Monooxygenase n=1 Tax=Acinetobacter qingfengensis TaxID=1262585 RepID=A0A1E7R638_9GAMM|nr:LLM class flavin-dependent oxidoreductase [Acinetobacter qingfengensis]KAA8734874.1 LLM class flavin-dependent oxidoreductase [Acinetobacter qingfengensis]OEY94794.1 monooxygenase [Acinetobacter qingfengensis]